MKAHRTDVVSFAFGLVFLGLSVWWLLARILGLVLPPVGWFLAGALILVGLLSLVGALRSGRHTDPEPPGPGPAATFAAPGTSPTSGAPGTSPTSGAPGTSPTSGAPGMSAADEWATDVVDDPEWPAGRGAAGGPRTDGDSPRRDGR